MSIKKCDLLEQFISILFGGLLLFSPRERKEGGKALQGLFSSLGDVIGMDVRCLLASSGMVF